MTDPNNIEIKITNYSRDKSGLKLNTFTNKVKMVLRRKGIDIKFDSEIINKA